MVRIALVSLIAVAASALAAPAGNNNKRSNANAVDNADNGSGSDGGGLDIQGVKISEEELQSLKKQNLVAAEARLKQLASTTPANPEAFRKQATVLREKAREGLDNVDDNDDAN